jgi:hypothetical protein
VIRRKSTVHAMFVWQGFLTRGTADITWTEDDAERHGGQIGAAMRIAEVFDYEVSETLGVWFRDNAATPLEAVRRKARDLVHRFFAHDSSGSQ